MNVIFVILPLAVLLSASAVLAFLWATHHGQFDDLETPALRALHEDTRLGSTQERTPEDHTDG